MVIYLKTATYICLERNFLKVNVAIDSIDDVSDSFWSYSSFIDVQKLFEKEEKENEITQIARQYSTLR